MPSPRKKLSPTPTSSVRLRSERLRALVRNEQQDDDISTRASNTKSQTNSKKLKGRSIAAAKKKNISNGKSGRNVKMTVLALAAARKRRLNGEDDDDFATIKKKVKKRTVKKKKKNVVANKILTMESEEKDDINEQIGDFVNSNIVIKTENDSYDEDDGEGVANDNDDDDDDNLLITDDNQFDGSPQLIHHEIEIGNDEEMRTSFPNRMSDDEGEDDDDDIDENLFFGIPEQRSPELGTCSHCKGKFRKEDLHDHMISCPERYVQCRECGKILSNIQTLERHHKRFHLKIREVPCTLCDKMFIDEAAARKHLKTVHFKVKNFHCPHCDKSFSQRNKLTYHVRTHSGEKPYSCAECGRSFSLLWNLKTHLRTHTGEKPYSCEICGRRFTQKQNMTSHLTTHRKPKVDKGYRTHFAGELDDFDSTALLTAQLASKAKVFSSLDEQTKQLVSQAISSGQYVLGDMQNVELTTANGNVENVDGLGLLSSVARKGGINTSNEVQVDGIVDNLAGSHNMDQVVEVLLQNSETVKTEILHNNAQLGNATNNQSKIVLNPSTNVLMDTNGQEISLDSNTAAGLANILQNPEVLAAINSAASSSKFIVIGPVTMFDNDSIDTGMNVISTISDTNTSTQLVSINNFSQEQLPQLASVLPHNTRSEVSTRSVSDTISASSALSAVENYVKQVTPSTSSTVPDDMNIRLNRITANTNSSTNTYLPTPGSSRQSNLTISMPPMLNRHSSLTNPHPQNIVADSTHQLKPPLKRNPVPTGSEVSSSIDANHLTVNPNRLNFNSVGMHQQMEPESTSQNNEYSIQNSMVANDFPANSSAVVGMADSSGMLIDQENVASSNDDPILVLGSDENGQPQIIVKMPDGSETIMSDPALAQSLIQVPTISNNDIDSVADDNVPTQSMVMNDSPNINVNVPIPDQGIPTESVQLPSQSTITDNFTTNNIADQYLTASSSSHALNAPDQSINVTPSSIDMPDEGALSSPVQSINVTPSTIDIPDDRILHAPDQSINISPSTIDIPDDGALHAPDQSINITPSTIDAPDDGVLHAPDQSVNIARSTNDVPDDGALNAPDQSINVTPSTIHIPGDGVLHAPDQSINITPSTIDIPDDGVDSSENTSQEDLPDSIAECDTQSYSDHAPDSSSSSQTHLVRSEINDESHCNELVSTSDILNNIQHESKVESTDGNEAIASTNDCNDVETSATQDNIAISFFHSTDHITNSSIVSEQIEEPSQSTSIENDTFVPANISLSEVVTDSQMIDQVNGDVTTNENIVDSSSNCRSNTETENLVQMDAVTQSSSDVSEINDTSLNECRSDTENVTSSECVNSEY